MARVLMSMIDCMERWERAMNTCQLQCWTAVPCPTCGRPLNPVGRSIPLEMYEPECCQSAKYFAANQRHLWSEHDSTRTYTDPDGWREHVSQCEQCATEVSA